MWGLLRSSDWRCCCWPSSHRQPPCRTETIPCFFCCCGIGLLGVALCAGFRAGVPTGLGLVGCALGYALALRWAYRSLEGMNGDIAGYALTMGELVGLAVYALL